MQGDCFRQNDGFPEFDLHLAKRVLGDKLPILKIVKHCFERSDLPFDSFGLVGLVKMGDILFQGGWSDVWQLCLCDITGKLRYAFMVLASSRFCREQ